jgi:hypothetical protein
MLKEKLEALYNDGSKHSRYQNIPEFVRNELGYTETIDENWRGDTARFSYLTKTLQFGKGKSIGEIGANTGFFMLSLAHANPSSTFYAYEINTTHAAFIHDIAESFEMKNLVVKAQGVDMQGIELMENHDILLNYNVLHHAGVDFDTDMIASVEEYEAYATEYLKRMAHKTKKMVFQIGSNWGGNKLKPLIPLSDDAEKIAFNIRLFKNSGWKVLDISLHTRLNGFLDYRGLSANVLEQLNACPVGEEKSLIEKLVDLSEFPSFSEFYRRPIFIVESK